MSVVIPVYNVRQYLCQCLDSFVNQTLKNIQVICVDDGSTDGSAELLDEYSRQDSRFCVIHQRNGGPGSARNAGLERACGDYVLFFDSDDWAEPEFLHKMYERIRETEADVAICRAVEFDTNTGKDRPSDWMLKTDLLPAEMVFSPRDVAEHLFQFAYGMPWDKLYRREYVLETGVLFPPLYNSEDLAFVFPTLISAGRIAVLDEALIHHRVNRRASVSNTRERQPKAPYDAFQIVKAYLDERGLMDLYEKSFLNWAMEFLIWHVSNMGNDSIRRQYFQTLRHVWLPQLNFSSHPASYYENKACYGKYLLAQYAPYPLFSVVVKGYKKIKKLVSAS